ncbi:hypothetical protein [Spartinivicinus ruber]|uniref:hypothetical protein n=1 Tax=Spartinivicinus ruber TaxID=2683272 RepID=UPI0013D083F8|nr:hypothetical protein [Spartinivicinus ruber]
MKPVYLFALILMTVADASHAGECTSNSFRPTFVRHNAVAPTVYYVTSSRQFIPMATPTQAQQTCQANGVRQLIGGLDCNRRSWGGFGCGCNIMPSRNTTCATFQNFLRGQGIRL